MAESISKLSPMAVQGTKYYLVHARDHSVEDGLEAMVTLNSNVEANDITLTFSSLESLEWSHVAK